jgi:hypothetical protein
MARAALRLRLAALCSGFVRSRELVLAGHLAADEPAMGALTALFGGTMPTWVDSF